MFASESVVSTLHGELCLYSCQWGCSDVRAPLPISDIDSGSMRENTAPEVTKGVTVRQLP